MTIDLVKTAGEMAELAEPTADAETSHSRAEDIERTRRVLDDIARLVRVMKRSRQRDQTQAARRHNSTTGIAARSATRGAAGLTPAAQQESIR
jgi:hypothetical protein